MLVITADARSAVLPAVQPILKSPVAHLVVPRRQYHVLILSALPENGVYGRLVYPSLDQLALYPMCPAPYALYCPLASLKKR